MSCNCCNCGGKLPASQCSKPRVDARNCLKDRVKITNEEARKNPFLYKTDRFGNILSVKTVGILETKKIITEQLNIVNSQTGETTSPPPSNASYVVISANNDLTAERVLTAGIGISLTDGGANSAITINATAKSFDDQASYIVLSATGSLDNERVLTAGTGISLSDGGAGNNLTISNTKPFDDQASYVVIGLTGSLPNERKLTAGTNISLADGGVGGNITINSTTFAPTNSSYVTISSEASLSAERRLVAGSNITITDNGANSTVSIAATGGAPTDASYVVLGTNATLTSERVLTAGVGISLTDAGAGSTITVKNTKPFDDQASYVVLGATGSLANERVLTGGTNITLNDAGAGSTITINGDNFDLSQIGDNSTTTAKATFTMTAGTQCIFETNGASDVLVIDNTNANVGIKNSSPSADFALDVTGKTRISSTLEISASGADITGDVGITGNLTVTGTKNFLIRHPNPKYSKKYYLRHSAVEAPTRGENLYRFQKLIENVANPEIIRLPNYYKFLNENSQVFVSPYKHFGSGWGEVKNNKLYIYCNAVGQYNILVIGTRKDKDAIKSWDKRGKEKLLQKNK